MRKILDRIVFIHVFGCLYFSDAFSAITFVITTFSIKTLSSMGFITAQQNSTEHNVMPSVSFFFVMLSVAVLIVMLNVVMLNVVMLIVVALYA